MKKQADQEPRIVVIGGGTGSFMLLSELKNRRGHITAIVNMADDGGSTGVLRDELGALPPGDIRQCLVALSDSPQLRELFNYRFEDGTFGGHSFGNIFLSTLEKTTGSFSDAVETASKILRVRGKVIPATLDDVRLKMTWPDNDAATLSGERVIDAEHFKQDPRHANLSLEPNPIVNPHAITAIEEADLIVIAPGDLYTSLGPLLVIDGIGDAIRSSTAKKVYVCNLVTKHGQTDGFSVEDHVAEIERFAGGPFLDAIIYNKQQPDDELAKKYEEEEAYVVQRAGNDDTAYNWIGGDLIGTIENREASDTIAVTRSYIRHNASEVVNNIELLYNMNNVN